MTPRPRAAICLGLALAACLAATALAQQPKAQSDAPGGADGGQSGGIKAINEKFDREHREVESRRIQALADLARGQSGEEAEATYRYLFSLAVLEGRVDDAEEAAQAYLKRDGGEARTRAMAAFVLMSAAASREEYDRATEIFQTFLEGQESGKADPQLLYGLGESFLQRLIADEQFEVARKVATLFTEGPFDREVKDHFRARLERLEMLGRPAPAVSGRDVDGEPVSLEELRGKVVLVEFWATWSPSSVTTIPRLNDLYQRFGDEGLEIVGVNVDASREGTDRDESRSEVRSFLVEFLVPWRVVLNGPGDEDWASRFGVTEIPASFLIDREGKVARVELTGPALEQAVAKLLGVEAEATAAPAPAGAGGDPGSAPTRPIRRPR